MKHMDEPRIKYAIDTHTETIVDAQAVYLLHNKFYKCIKCRGRLIVRQGEIQVWHFKHAGDDEESIKCPLYRKGANENLIKEIRTTDEEKDEREKNIPLIIQSNPYGSSLSLFGVLPTLDIENSINNTNVDDILNSFQIIGNGLKRKPESTLFRPSEPEARFELNSSARQYAIEIRSDMDIPKLCGLWTAEALHDSDMFVGDEIRAKRVKKEKIKTSEGDFIYILLSNKPENLPNQIQIKRLDNWFVIVFELTQENSIILQRFTGISWKNSHPFYVDIILPVQANPSASEPIPGEPNSDIFIAILPPPDLDPEFEVVSVPLKSDDIQLIEKTGNNAPRWFKTTFPDNGSRKLSIHLADFHRIIHMYAKQDNSDFENIKEKMNEEKFMGIINKNSDLEELVHAWISKDINVKIKINNNYKHLNDLRISFQYPQGLHFDLTAVFSENSQIHSKIIRRYDITIEDLNKEFYSWVRHGLKELVFYFGALGSTVVHLDPLQRREKRPTIKELKNKLKEGNLPKKANWSFIFSTLGIPPRTRHKEIHSGIKKQFRRLLKEMKKNETRK